MTGPMTPPSPTAVSTAHVKTDRPARYGRQLTSHMGRKISAAWDEASSTGSLDMNRGGTSTGVCDLSCQPGALVLRLSSDEEHLAHLEEVIGIPLLNAPALARELGWLTMILDTGIIRPK